MLKKISQGLLGLAAGVALQAHAAPSYSVAMGPGWATDLVDVNAKGQAVGSVWVPCSYLTDQG